MEEQAVVLEETWSIDTKQPFGYKLSKIQKNAAKNSMSLTEVHDIQKTKMTTKKEARDC